MWCVPNVYPLILDAKKRKKGQKEVFFLSYFGVFRRNALWYRRYMMVKKVLMGGCGKKKI
jgi:hypothetical protein